MDMEKQESGLEIERGPLETLEEKIGTLLTRYQELKQERDQLAGALDQERDRVKRLGREMESLSQDKEKIRTRIDQLLQRLKGIDI